MTISGVNIIPLLVIFGGIFFFRYLRSHRMIKPRQIREARPPPTMIKTPWQTDEYRDAIVSVLSPGEVL
ncbi:uncharacterized protein METZ01_LOCUS362410, partial [marine metagenome]